VLILLFTPSSRYSYIMDGCEGGINIGATTGNVKNGHEFEFLEDTEVNGVCYPSPRSVVTRYIYNRPCTFNRPSHHAFGTSLRKHFGWMNIVKLMPSISFGEVRARGKRDTWGWSVEGAWSVEGVATVTHYRDSAFKKKEKKGEQDQSMDRSSYNTVINSTIGHQSSVEKVETILDSTAGSVRESRSHGSRLHVAGASPPQAKVH
jgi:hypothetical protein